MKRFTRWRYNYNINIKNPDIGKCINELERTQWLSTNKLKKIQWEKLKKLINYAYTNIPYYRDLFNKNSIAPNAIKNPDDFRKIPFTGKRDIQQELDRFLSVNLEKKNYVTNHTGGSTGDVLTFYLCNNYLKYAKAARDLCYKMCGYSVGERQVFLWGSEFDSKKHTSLKGRLRDRLSNIKFINTFNLSNRRIEQYVNELARWKPDYIWGYTSSIELLARYIRENDIDGIYPKAIQTTAETLTDTQRKIIEDVFHCRVFNRYGSREVSLIAHECSKHAGLHIMDFNNLVEIVDSSGKPTKDGQIGRVIVTNLNNYAMPFIRYEIGDLAKSKYGKCSCGRGLGLIDRVVGRVSDTIISPSGKLIHGEFFTHLFYRTSGIRQFQVIQNTRKELNVRIVKDIKFSEKNINFLKNAIRKYGDKDFIINFDFCETIHSSKSGKYRFTVSNVTH